MPDLDDRLRRALRAAGRRPGTEGVVERVTTKRTRRRTVRRVELAVAAVVVVAIVAGSALAFVRRRDDGTRRVATAPAGGPPVQVYAGSGTQGQPTTVNAHRIGVPGDPYVWGPIGRLAERWWVVTGAPGDPAREPAPSHVVPIEGARERIETQGSPQSFTEGEGARWIVTRDFTTLGPNDPEYRVKRVVPGADTNVESTPIPRPLRPAGPVIANAGGVWVPHRDGVLRFDPATGQLVASVAMAYATDRSVAVVGADVWATDGAGVRRIDMQMKTGGPLQVLASPGEVVTRLVTTPDVAWALVTGPRAGDWSLLRVSRDLARVDARVPLPSDALYDLSATDDRVWVTGADNVLLVDARSNRVERTLAMPTTDGSSPPVWVARNRVLFTGDGKLYEVKLP